MRSSCVGPLIDIREFAILRGASQKPLFSWIKWKKKGKAEPVGGVVSACNAKSEERPYDNDRVSLW